MSNIISRKHKHKDYVLLYFFLDEMVFQAVGSLFIACLTFCMFIILLKMIFTIVYYLSYWRIYLSYKMEKERKQEEVVKISALFLFADL